MRNEGSQSVSLVYLAVRTSFQFTHNIYVMLGSFRQKWRWWVKLKPPRLASPWSPPQRRLLQRCCTEAGAAGRPECVPGSGCSCWSVWGHLSRTGDKHSVAALEHQVLGMIWCVLHLSSEEANAFPLFGGGGIAPACMCVGICHLSPALCGAGRCVSVYVCIHM